jgi:hypothetical protein
MKFKNDYTINQRKKKMPPVAQGHLLYAIVKDLSFIVSDAKFISLNLVLCYENKKGTVFIRALVCVPFVHQKLRYSGRLNT